MTGFARRSVGLPVPVSIFLSRCCASALPAERGRASVGRAAGLVLGWSQSVWVEEPEEEEGCRRPQQDPQPLGRQEPNFYP